MTVSEAADHLKLTRQTVLHHIEVGHLRAEKAGRIYLLRRTDVESFTPGKSGPPRGRPRTPAAGEGADA